jgi:hypothetical protein
MRVILSTLALALVLTPVTAAQQNEDKKSSSEMVWEATLRGISG